MSDSEVQIASPGAAPDVSEEPPSAGGPKRGIGKPLRILGWLLAFGALAALVAWGVYTLRGLNVTRTAEAAIAEASGILDEAEDELLVVDEAVQVEISAEVASQTAEAAVLAEDVRARTLEASGIIADARADLPEEMLPLADALKESADARAEMMQVAPVILKASQQAAVAIGSADAAVAEIKAAEDLSGQAVAEFNKHTSAGVKASDDLSVQAEGRLKTAQSLLATATASFPGADFSAFGAYVDAKIGLIGMAKEIDALWLSGNVSGSNSKLTAYNQRDAEVVAMAQALPASIRDPIADAYNAATADASTRYFEARERARTAGEKAAELRQTSTSE